LILFQVVRPHSIGIVYTQHFNTYAELEPVLENYIEKKCDQGWHATEFKGSSSNAGAIELVHDDVADSIIVRWLRLRDI